MDTKPLLDIIADMPSATQIAEAKKSIQEQIRLLNERLADTNTQSNHPLDDRIAELDAKINQLQQQNADLAALLDQCLKALQNQTSLISGMNKIINDRYSDTAEAIRQCNERIDIISYTPQEKPTKPSNSSKPSKPSTPSTPASSSSPTTPTTPSSPTSSSTPTTPSTPTPIETPDPAPVQTLANSIHVEESLADRLSKTVEHNTLASTLNTSHIESIKTAITIADRFRFQRELFSGNGALMGSTIDQLDLLTSIDQAEAYIAKNFKWNDDNQAVQDFMAILARRY